MMHLAVQVVHGQVAVVGTHNLLVAEAASTGLMEAAVVEAEKLFDRRGFVDLVVGLVEGHLAAEDIREVPATVGIRSLAALKVQLVAGWARQTTDDCRRVNHNGQ
jgi:hypothetical protein